MDDEIIHNLSETERDEIMDAVGKTVAYQEPEDVWAGIIRSTGKTASEIKEVLNEFTNATDLASQTDLSEEQVNLFTVMHSLAESYPGLGFEKFPKWFHRLRLSLNRQSRMETVEVLRGRLQLKTQEEMEMSRAGKF